LKGVPYMFISSVAQQVDRIERYGKCWMIN
jgi:hypothetical protein